MGRFIKKWLLFLFGLVFGLIFLLAGPILINYMFLTETTGWHMNLTFSAGEMLQYYGAVLGGIVTCFAIITTMHINNKNRRQDWQRQQFERAYALYHKLPEILAKLELSAIHVQYSVHISEENLLETMDSMKESESLLREHHIAHDTYYSPRIESILKTIISASVKCQELSENYLKAKKSNREDIDSYRKIMEDSFIALRELIKSAKSEITAEINQFISVHSDDRAFR